MHKLEGQISDQFSAHSTAVESHTGAVRNGDTKNVIWVLSLGHEGGGSQVGITVLEQMSVENI